MALSVIVTASCGRGRAMAGDGQYDSGLSTRAIAATVTQSHRTKNATDRGAFGSMATLRPISSLDKMALILSQIDSIPVKVHFTTIRFILYTYLQFIHNSKKGK
ncbi:hypothetical protein AVEN_192750-1 [Araneus ventricosus]|uniref:Uncharacterized protein n=1 Tax=Araneus ventricosus TaxID=182803 RepID=A0A4Y2ER69_ARAVE|nr:hypothetical protein AVEN_192750-1 [Araneus ventricosus]